MKRTAYFNPLAAARLVLAAACIFLAAACTTDDDPSRPDNNDGPVPLTFTALRPAPMTAANTRTVPGKDEWKGDGTEKIGVKLDDGTGKATGVYTITDKDGTVSVLPGDKPVFWPDKTGQYYIDACYPLPGEYDISDQSTPEKLTMVDFIQATVDNCSPDGGPVALRFRHILAKVRVELTGVAPDAGDIKVEIRHYNHLVLRHEGFYSNLFSGSVYIIACRDASTTGKVAFEALVPTGTTVVKENFIRITVGNQKYFFTPEGDERGLVSFSPAGSVHTDRITLPATATATTASAGHPAVAAAVEGVAVEAVP